MKLQRSLFKLTMLLGIISVAIGVDAQEVISDFQTRASFKLSLQAVKKLQVSFSPEVRFNETLNLSKFLIETEASYKLSKLILVGGAYRFIGDQKNSGTQYLHRMAAYTELEKKFYRFEPSVRLMYTNYSEDAVNTNFLRYKAGVSYDIPKSSLTPKVGIEAYQKLNTNQFYKMRYSAGVQYKLKKDNFIGLSYKLDYYLQAYRNKHIIAVNYKFKF